MGGSLRDNLVKNILVKNEVQASFPYLIEIWAESDKEKENCYRYVNATEDKVFIEKINKDTQNEETVSNVFTAAYFKISPPEKTENGIKDAKITISSIDQFWIEKIRESQERYKIRFVAAIDYYYNSKGQQEEYIEPLDDLTFTLTEARWNESAIEWSMKFDVGMELNVPCQILTQFSCPALF